MRYSEMRLETQPSIHSAATKAENTAEEATRARVQRCCAHIPVVCFPICCRRRRDSQLISRPFVRLQSLSAPRPDTLPFEDFTTRATRKSRVHESAAFRPSVCLSSRKNFTSLWKCCKLLNTMVSCGEFKKMVLIFFFFFKSFKHTITLNKKKEKKGLSHESFICVECIQLRSYAFFCGARRKQTNSRLLTPKTYTKGNHLSSDNNELQKPRDTASRCVWLGARWNQFSWDWYRLKH